MLIQHGAQAQSCVVVLTLLKRGWLTNTTFGVMLSAVFGRFVWAFRIFKPFHIFLKVLWDQLGPFGINLSNLPLRSTSYLDPNPQHSVEEEKKIHALCLAGDVTDRS